MGDNSDIYQHEYKKGRDRPRLQFAQENDTPFEEALAKHGASWLREIQKRVGGTLYDAEDVFQNAICVAWEKYAAGEIRHATSYIHTCIANTIRDLYREDEKTARHVNIDGKCARLSWDDEEDDVRLEETFKDYSAPDPHDHAIKSEILDIRRRLLPLVESKTISNRAFREDMAELARKGQLTKRMKEWLKMT